jgi:hypothetical protein
VPILLHIALVLFFIGIILWLIVLDSASLIIPTAVLVGIGVILYVVAAILPSFSETAPFQWPISTGIKYLLCRNETHLTPMGRYPPLLGGFPPPQHESAHRIAGGDPLARSGYRSKSHYAWVGQCYKSIATRWVSFLDVVGPPPLLGGTYIAYRWDLPSRTGGISYYSRIDQRYLNPAFV